jgi:hypothetical protein
MRKHGYEVDRTPLPPISDPKLEKVEFHPMPPPGEPTSSGAAPATKSYSPIRVSENLSSLHPLVEATRKQLRSATADDNRIVHENAEAALNVAVASASITRALKIMNALICAWEEIGGSVKHGVRSFLGHHSTAFGIDKDEVLVSLKERTEPIPDWKSPKETYWHRYPPRRPNGEFVFAVENYLREGLRSPPVRRQRRQRAVTSVKTLPASGQNGDPMSPPPSTPTARSRSTGFTATITYAGRRRGRLT